MKLKVFFLLINILTPILTMGNLDNRAKGVGVLTEFKNCFAEKQSVEQLINQWTWGQIRLAFMFSFNPPNTDDKKLCWIAAVCPPSSNDNRICLLEDFPNVCDLEKNDQVYLTFGFEKENKHGNYTLTFMQCEKTSSLYQVICEHLNLKEPLYLEAQVKSPTQCWTTRVSEETTFLFSSVDRQFVRWEEIFFEVELIWIFNQQECVGLKLVRKNQIHSPQILEKEIKKIGSLNLSCCDEEFRWIPVQQAEEFIKTRDRLILAGRKAPSLYDFNRNLKLYEHNGEYIKSLGLDFIGTVKTPVSYFDAPWRDVSYYKTPNGNLFLRSFGVRRGWYSIEHINSFVLQLEDINDKNGLELPHGIDIKPYLQAYPTSNLLYEHIRADGRARIIVQPYIASLYVDGKLNKILVCNDKNGPADHGWSLVRKYYCYEEMPEYFWPVSHAYCPLELD